MPELPDIDLYVEKINERTHGQTLLNIRVGKPFLVRSFDPPLTAANGRQVVEIRRLGKRIVFGLDADYWLILHLMVAGRLQWHDRPADLVGKNRLAAFDFSSGCLTLTEAGSKKRASLYLVHGEPDLAAHDPGGLEPLQCSLEEFRTRLLKENRTAKRALTSPKIFSGIGNAYSDEILHAAKISPIKLTHRMTDSEIHALFDAVRTTLQSWRDRLSEQSKDRFPDNVTAFRDEMAVHGKYGKPCPQCGGRVARIRYKTNETNYCPGCQTNGRLLADRSLSRLLKDGWPGSL